MQTASSLPGIVWLRMIPNDELHDSIKDVTIWDILYPWPGLYLDEPDEYNTETYRDARYNIIKDKVTSGKWSVQELTTRAPLESRDGLYWGISGHTPLMIAVEMVDEKYSLKLTRLFLQHGAGGKNLKILAVPSGDTVLHKVVNCPRVNQILPLITGDNGFDNDLLSIQNHISETASDSAKYFQSIYGISDTNLASILPLR